jgi:hypothetical protein
VSTFPVETAHTIAQHADERNYDDAASSGYDHRGFRLGLLDIICSWAFSAIVVVLIFAIFA